LREFQQLLDTESQWREQLLDWFMFDIRTKRLVFDKDWHLKPNRR
jgi:hypothetical protein